MKNAISANNTTKAILSVPEAADYLTVSTRTLRTWVAERKIRVARLGGRVVLRLVDVDRFVEKRLEGGVL
jgi:excisionase family DNA binding protein